MISARIVSAASFPDRVRRLWYLEASFGQTQIQSLNTVPQLLYTPPTGYLVIPRYADGALTAGGVAFSGAVALGLTVGSTAFAAVLLMTDGDPAVYNTINDSTVFDGTDLSAEIGLPLSLTSGADRTAGGATAKLTVFVEFWTVKASDLIA